MQLWSITLNTVIIYIIALFFFLFGCFTADDIRLNSRVFQWPKQIEIELDDSVTRLASLRIQVEKNLQKR